MHEHSTECESNSWTFVLVHTIRLCRVMVSIHFLQDLLIRHLLDVMHIEKNITESLIKFLEGTKDTVKVRQDLKVRNQHSHLWPTADVKTPGKFVKPLAPWLLSKQDKKIFHKRISNLRVPTGYAAAFKKHVKHKTKVLGGMKSHDYHVMMQQILPVCLRGLMQKPVRMTIIQLSLVFQRLCTRVWDPADLSCLRKDAITTLCQLEMHFPPAFFDVMTHLLVHLVEELDICGPVHARWMYPMERYLKLLKNHVRTMCRPEASMALGYMKDETIGYISEYMDMKPRMWDADKNDAVAGEVLQGAGIRICISVAQRDAAHLYVLRNTEIMRPWLE